MASQVDSTKLRRVNTFPSQTIKKKKGRERNSFCETSIVLIPKAEKDTPLAHTHKLQANIIDEHRCKNPQQNISKPNSTIHQKDHTP